LERIFNKDNDAWKGYEKRESDESELGCSLE
jgi:hypothetical protein